MNTASDDIERYRALLAEDPSSRAFGLLAEAYLRLGRYTDAIAVCDLGLQHYPAYTGARLLLARALSAHGEVPRAEAEFRRVLESIPDSLAAHRGLADLLRQQGRVAEAMVLYEGLLELDPFDQEVRDLAEVLRPAGLPGLEAVRPGAAAEPGLEIEVPLASAEPEPAVPTYDLTSAAATEEPLPMIPVLAEPAVAPFPEEPAPPRPASGIPAPAPLEPEAPAPVFDWSDLARADEEEPPFVPVESLAAEEASPRAILATETLADLYVRQGSSDQARAIYEELLRADPTRADLRGKLAALQAPPATWGVAAEPEPEPVGVAASAPAAEADELVRTLEAWLAAARTLRRERGGA